MKPLPLAFRKGGFDYVQVLRQGMVAIYRQTKPDQSWESYEVGKIRQNKARHQFGKDLEAAESWPSSEEWGVKAWSYPDLASAKRRMFALIPPDNQNALNP